MLFCGISFLCLFVALLNYAQQVWHLRDGAAHRLAVRTLDYLVQLSQTQTAHDRFMRFWGGDKASIVLDTNLRLLFFVCIRSTWHNSHLVNLFTAQTRQLHRILHP